MFENFDLNLFDDPEFKEDSVREEIISPMLKKLGYNASGNNKIVRSKSIVHPYVYIGSQKRKINIIPDYLLEVDGKPVFILDAKSPNENILQGKNPEQAFSYAIHPEIRVKYYGLCNGRELTVFDVSKIEPLIHFKFENFDKEWDKIYKLLSPTGLTKPGVLDYQPDFGLYLLKSGWNKQITLHFIGAWVNFVAKLNDQNYTLVSSIKFDEDQVYAASFDFDIDLFDEFISALPNSRQDSIIEGLSNQPFSMHFDKETTFEIIIHAKFGSKVYTNKNESYLPFEVTKFEEFD